MQMTPHDEWDYDGINEVILFDKGGKTYAWQTLNLIMLTWLKNVTFVTKSN
jgi:glucose dehydrogenase